MAKALKTAALIVGVAALAATGIGLVVGAAAAAAITIAGVALPTLAAALGVAASVLSVAAGMAQKKPKLGSAGTQLDFIADPAAGLPYMIGQGRVGMNIVHEASWGERNRYLGIVGVLSCAGPIFSYDGLYGDNTLLPIGGGGAATGYYAGFLWHRHLQGARPEAAALDMSVPSGGSMPDWGAAYKLSGLASSGMILKADVDNGKIFAAGTPQLTHQIKGVLAYDARLDSTQPGGSGAQLALDETTYAYSENPWVHAETYAMARWANGVKLIGPGLAPAGIDFPAFMEAANIADANGWKCSGRVYSTDPKWDVLKAIAQAGGGQPMPSGARLSCLVNAPRVSLETITEADARGVVNAPQMLTRRQRLNGAIPRYRSSSHGWEIVPGNAVRSAAYLAADGGREHTREVEFALVADQGDGLGLAQAAQLAAYEVANTRERGPISVELGYYWSQYGNGDCLTLDFPEANLHTQKCIVIGRTINVTRNTITLQFRTEDDAKHAWALGLSGAAPPPTTVGAAPGAGDVGAGYTVAEIQNILRSTYLVGTVDAIDAGSGTATIRLYGATTADNFTLDYRLGSITAPSIPPQNITGLAYATTYYPYIDVDPVTLLPASYGAATVFGGSINSAAHPYRIGLQRTVTTPVSGGAPSGGGGMGGGVAGGGTGAGGLPV